MKNDLNIQVMEQEDNQVNDHLVKENPKGLNDH
jgi:hypothetical protein